MQELNGQRKGSKKYYYDGFFYHVDPRYPDYKRAYICSLRFCDWQCKVTARSDANGKIRVNGEHTHSRESLEEHLQRQKYRDELKKQARESDALPHEIVKSLRTKYRNLNIKPLTAKMLIIRERKKERPNLPKNLKDAGNLLKEYRPAQKIYQEQVVINELSSAVIFASNDMLQYLNHCHEIYVDGTFKCVPKGIGAKQLLILHMRKMDVGMAAVYVICSNRTAELYVAIWECILRRVPGLKKKLKFITMDFERALINSVRTSMPWVTIRGCWFHYTKAISTHWRNLGLKDLRSELLQDLLALTWNLPLLPAKEFPTAIKFFYEKTKRLEPEYQEIARCFLNYLETQWLPIAEVVSVWRSPTRTNNICESFNKKISKCLGCHPNLYDFIKKLAILIDEIEGNWKDLEKDGSIKRYKKTKWAQADSYIKEQQVHLTNGRLSVSEFLMAVKTENIKKIIKEKMDAPLNVKEYDPDEIVSPKELIELLELPQTAPEVLQDKMNEMMEIYMIIEEKESDKFETAATRRPSPSPECPAVVSETLPDERQNLLQKTKPVRIPRESKKELYRIADDDKWMGPSQRPDKPKTYSRFEKR